MLFGQQTDDSLELIRDKDYTIVTTKAKGLTIQVGKASMTLADYFREYSPRIRFVDQSCLEGNILVKTTSSPPTYNLDNVIALDWSDTNIKKESQGITRNPESVQYRIIQDLLKSNDYEVIFDDDGSGEIADIVTIKEADEKITFGFYHCKFSLAKTPGARIDDLYTVCGQAEKSIKWCSDTRLIIDRLIIREAERFRKHGGTRIERGSLQKMKEIKNKLRLYPSSVEITIVQPGVDSKNISEDMLQLLSGTAAYLLDTFGIHLKLICS